MANPKGHKTWDKEKFISKAIEIHGNKFDYSLVHEFNNYKCDKVKIKCNICGNIFETTPSIHLKSGKGGCKICSKKQKWTTELFIKEASKKHNNKYDYSLVNIEECRKNKTEFITIICPIHGKFQQKWKLHLAGMGCKQCFLESQFNTLDEFIEKAKLVHGDKYDYSKAIYKGRNYDINITCPIHGEFITKAVYHLHGCGCNKCSHNFNFYKYEKLDLLSKYDLESMSWTVILDLIGLDKLPSEFSKLCKYGENTPERKKMIQDLIDSYNIEVPENDIDEEINNDSINNDNIETEVNDITNEDTNIYNDENEELNPFKELKDIGELLGEDDEQFFSTGDKFIHLFNKSMHQLWNRVLRDNENHNENTINEIHQKLINNSLTKYEKYIYEEFMKEYDEVINLEIH